MVEALLLENAEHAGLGGVAGHSGRDLRARDQPRAAVDVDLLVAKGDDENHRLAIGGIGDSLLGGLIVRLYFLGVGRRNGNRYREGGDAEKGQECR